MTKRRDTLRVWPVSVSISYHTDAQNLQPKHFSNKKQDLTAIYCYFPSLKFVLFIYTYNKCCGIIHDHIFYLIFFKVHALLIVSNHWSEFCMIHIISNAGNGFFVLSPIPPLFQYLILNPLCKHQIVKSKVTYRVCGYLCINRAHSWM